MQHSVDPEGVDIRYGIEPHVSRERGLKVRGWKKWREREKEREEADIGESQQTAVLTLWVHCGGSKAAA